MWHKITNFFAPQNTTDTLQISNESIEADVYTLKPEAKENIHHDYRRTPEDRENILLDEGGILAPVQHFRRISRSFHIEKVFGDKKVASNEAKQIPRQKRFIHFNTREVDYGDSSESSDENENEKATSEEKKRSQPIVEEFDQGQVEKDRRKRYALLSSS
ncbi:hypothetical protein TNIN_100191 [Trichonephila inaurata madagascariensis]|uniref:Uncharacterized protein n=1 Tax=Trichonephila inaurata madagascariensis TaxID=2747483 RepID=A0A8X7BT62_9ARAC|nr:hypothetical protein TNIN_100191 [Trichonephila inaurata madagascariensis]